ncbi:MAG: L-threonylcarbamoyladenylate synthase [Ilumatobacteraceae bacterium]
MLTPTTDVDRAVAAIERGGLVAIPTETVYGLAADATNPAAVRRIFEIKGRPAGHPLIVHLADAAQLDDWAREIPTGARTLVALAWPGPLTVLLPRSDRVLDEVTGGRPSVGLRVPAHPLTAELIRRTRPLAAPSANRFGSVSPTTAAHVLADLGGRLDPEFDVILDGGACPVGVESTIVDFCRDPPQILRAGGVPPEQVEALLGTDLADASGPSRASGMLESHYAPSCPVLLVDTRAQADAESLIRPGSVVIDLTDDIAEYARTLYASLRSADDAAASCVIAVLPPAAGLGHAIRDRLVKAAAPRR